MRITGENLQSPEKRRKEIRIFVDEEPVTAYEGETIAAVLIANSRYTFRRTTKDCSPRGVYCGIGLCRECRVFVNNIPNVPACTTYVEPGMKVQVLNKEGF